ncbi:MAG: CDC48 family AAA ATPase [Candidatus Bathyarchaeia archaeon]
MANEIQLRVAEAKQRDVGRGKARIAQKIMDALDVMAGDVLEIKGKKSTAAIAWPAYPEDQGVDIIRVDGLVRRNAGVSLNEYITVKKVTAQNANSVTLAPVDVRIEFDPDFTNFVKSRLLEMPLVEGDVVLLSVFGNAMPFTVLRTKPGGIVKVTPTTAFQVLSEPSPEKKGIPRVTYEDIGGLHNEVQRIREMVELPLKHPELFQRLGIDPPKGVLLHGPPGCGKTLLAKAVANEAHAYFININGPEIMSKFYGESEARLREIFQKAQENVPSIIFIDEIDAIAPKREEVVGEVEKRVVAQLLSLMDGLQARGNVIVIGATNVPNILDPALRRPGRFDREVEIGVPDKEGRHEILLIHTRGMPLTKDVDLRKLSDITHGYTGADIAALSREAAMKALRRYLPDMNLEEERIPPNVLQSMEIRLEDFVSAYREITPTAMREVYIEIPNVTWDQVGGLEKVKNELREAVEWPLKYPQSFSKVGISPPRGILLYGPPGCGKTLLARAVATESESNFITIKGPEVFSKWVGESEKAIREVFRKARMSSPSIVFFDEFDALVPRRGVGFSDQGVSERVISQLLTEMDGIISLENIVVVAASNRPDILDPAVLRPGRFDRLVFIPSPDEKSRKNIFRIYTAKMPLTHDVDIDELAATTKGYSGADIQAVCREAGMSALRRNMAAKEVTKADFHEALAHVGPSLTPDLEKFYETFSHSLKKAERAVIPAPIA